VIEESPIVPLSVQTGIVFGVPLPLTAWAVAHVTAPRTMTNAAKTLARIRESRDFMMYLLSRFSESLGQ
jgi:hypothetical protein